MLPSKALSQWEREEPDFHVEELVLYSISYLWQALAPPAKLSTQNQCLKRDLDAGVLLPGSLCKQREAEVNFQHCSPVLFRTS